MRILVTGADGFVGGWLLRCLLQAGHHVIGGLRLGSAAPALLTERERLLVRWVEFDLLSPETVQGLAWERADAIAHLAAVASGSDARLDPGYAWTVNAAGTARLCEALGRRVTAGESNPLLLLASTGEVYGRGRAVPHREDDPLLPCSFLSERLLPLPVT